MFPNSPFAHAVGSFRTPVQPPDSEPDSGPLSSISINCDWLPFIRGALTQLLLQSTWKTDIVSLETTQKRAWRLINMFAEMDCEMCDCIVYIAGFPNKFVPDGHGGGTFVPIDPRIEGAADVPAPWPTPPSGQTGNCLAGKNNAETFKEAMNLIINAIGGAVIIAQIIILVTDLFELALPIWGEALAVVNEWALAIAGAGVTALAAAFQGSTADTVYDKLGCIIGCHADPDGRVTATELAAIRAEFTAYLPTSPLTGPEQLLWSFFADGWLENQGVNGLTLLGKSAGITSADCSGCDCGWCLIEDFRISDQGYSVYSGGGGSFGTYSAGDGFDSLPAVSHDEIAVLKHYTTFTAHKIVVKFDVLALGSIDQAKLCNGTGFCSDLANYTGWTVGSNTMTYDGADISISDISIDLISGFDLDREVILRSITFYGHGTVPSFGAPC